MVVYYDLKLVIIIYTCILSPFVPPLLITGSAILGKDVRKNQHIPKSNFFGLGPLRTE